ncbi:citrate/2-methylcitrate synthase, partial [Staphylococcus aureus]
MGNATFMRDDVSLDLPLVPATQGNNGYDIGKLLAGTGDTTIDIGFANTASCRSSITFIDGDAGILRYRGYPIEQLAEQSSFLEVSYLVLHGELPSADQLAAFSGRIAKYHL